MMVARPTFLSKMAATGGCIGLAAMIATPLAQAIFLQNFFNDLAIATNPENADKVQTAALVLSLKTEAFRNAQTGLGEKAQCNSREFFVFNR